MKKLIISLLLLLSVFTFSGFNGVSATYGGLDKNLDLNNRYGGNLNPEPEEVVYASSYYFGGDSSVEGLYEYGIGTNLQPIKYYSGDVNSTLGYGLDLHYEIGVTYTVSGYYDKIGGVYFQNVYIIAFDSGNNELLAINDSSTGGQSGNFEITYTVPANTTKLFLSLGTSTTKQLLLDDIMLEEGSTSSLYEQYTGLQRVTGVTDLDGVIYNDTVYERISRDYNDVVQSATGWSRENLQGSTYYYSLDLSSQLDYNIIGVGELPNISLKIGGVIYPIGEFNTIYSQSTIGVALYEPTNKLGIRSTEPDIASFEAYLQANDVEFIYERETPIKHSDAFGDYELDYVELVDFDTEPFLFNLTADFVDRIGASIPDIQFISDNLTYDSVGDQYYILFESNLPDIVKMECQYTANNLITNGDFNTFDGWNYINFGYFSLAGGYLRSITNGDGQTTIAQQDVSSPTGNLLYVTYNIGVGNYLGGVARFQIADKNDSVALYNHDISTNISNRPYSVLVNSLNGGIQVNLYSTNTPDMLVDYDDIIVFDLTALYGKGNEPTVEQFEALIDTSTYQESYTYLDDCYREDVGITLAREFFQYDDNSARVTVRANPSAVEYNVDVLPHFIVEKYDLDMNYLGLIYDGFNLGSSATVWLPACTTSEEGYIYIAYGDTAKSAVLGGGYVFKEYTGDFGRNTDALGVNGSIHKDVNTSNNLLFDSDDYTDYIYGDNDVVVMHYRYDSGVAGVDENITYFNENTDQVKVELIEDVRDKFSGYDNAGYYMFSLNSTLPTAIQFLKDNNVHIVSDSFNSVLSDYEADYINYFTDVGYADNKGVYTYSMYDNNTSDLIAIGETPLYYMNDFNNMTLQSHLIRLGNPFIVDVYQEGVYLPEFYDYQYVYDTNTTQFNFDSVVGTTGTTSVYMDIFQGLSLLGGNIQYHLRGTTASENSASIGSYDILIQDSYTIKEPKGINDTVTDFFDDLGINDTVGRLLISVVVIVGLAILVYMKSKNFIATLVVSFAVLGLLVLIGFIEAWVILFVVMIFAIIAYIVFNRSSSN